MTEQTENLNYDRKVDWKNRIIWIMLVTTFWYVFVFSIIGELLFYEDWGPLAHMDLSDPVLFALSYLSTCVSFIGILVYTLITKRNRFIFRSFMPTAAGNKLSALLAGLLVGFIMNFGCIAWALLAGDIKLFLNFAAGEIPFFLFALMCVFIQSTSEELWCRGFMYERINVHYPLWVAILVNSLFFAALHLGNPGAGFLPIADIAICGLSFSIAKWYTGSIWFPMGIHTAWNFTQNFLFGLPNSGIVSEASVFGLDAASAHDSLIYNVAFGVEGAVPAVLADAALGVICLLLAARQGRLGELKQKQVIPGKDPEGAQPICEFKYIKVDTEAEKWHYTDTNQ
ncbi:MAG: CPBP family intramembrane glutamic endopeptidase [Bacillota bacterium]